jgi:hypothetical protein
MLARFLPVALIAMLLFPLPAYAQSSVAGNSQDPYALTPEKMSLFGAGTDTSLNSLFNGDTQKGNGLFTTPDTQLGGAEPYSALIAPDRTNADQGGPTFIVLTSKYTPSGDLTSDSTVTLTVTVKNTGTNAANGVTLHATLQDKNAALVASPAPTPAITKESAIDKELVWNKLAGGQPFNLAAGASADFSWSFKATKNDTILRWRLIANYGASESILLQWIPIKNPNPQAAGPGSGGSTSGGSASNPCSTAAGSGPFPETSTMADLISLFKQHWNIILAPGTDGSAGSAADYTNPQYKGLLKAWWEVLVSVECTSYLTKALGGSPLTIQGYANGGGWWGEYVGGNVQYMWIDNISTGTIPHIKQNLIHELGHVYEGANSDIRAKFEAAVCGKGSVHAYISAYAEYGITTEGNGCNESFAEMNGYYVARESNEWGVGGAYCATKNPYDWNELIYYNFAKTEIWGGKEYGAPPPSPDGSC